MFETGFLMAAALATVAANPLVEIPMLASQQSGEISNIRLLVPLGPDDKAFRPRRPRAPPAFSPWHVQEYSDYSYEYPDREDDIQNLGHTRDSRTREYEPEKLGKTLNQRVRDVSDINLNEWIQSLDGTWIKDNDRNYLYDLNDRLHTASRNDEYTFSKNHVSPFESLAENIAANYHKKNKKIERFNEDVHDENDERLGEDVKNLEQIYAHLVKESREKLHPNMLKNKLRKKSNTVGKKIEDNDAIKAWLQKLDETLHFSENEDNLRYAFDGQKAPEEMEEPLDEFRNIVVLDHSQPLDGFFSKMLSEAQQENSEESHLKTVKKDLSAIPHLKAHNRNVLKAETAEAFELDSEGYSPGAITKDLSLTPQLKLLSDQSLCGDETKEDGYCGICCAIRQLVEELNFYEQKNLVSVDNAKPTDPVGVFTPRYNNKEQQLEGSNNMGILFEPGEKVEIFKTGKESQDIINPGKKPLDVGAMFSGLNPDMLHIDNFRVHEPSLVQKSQIYGTPFSPMEPVTLKPSPLVPDSLPMVSAGSGQAPDGVIPIILAMLPSQDKHIYARRDWKVLAPPAGTPNADRDGAIIV